MYHHRWQSQHLTFVSKYYTNVGFFCLLPKNPDMDLTVINVWTFGLKAVGTCRTAKAEKHTRYKVRLPKVSDRGARNKGPRPRKTTKPVVAPITTSPEVSRSPAIWAIPGVNIELARGLNTTPHQKTGNMTEYSGCVPAISAMMATLVSFLDLGQFLGSSSSQSVKSMILSYQRTAATQR